MQKASVAAQLLHSAKHLHERLGYDRSSSFIRWQVHLKSRKNAFLCLHLILFMYLFNCCDEGENCERSDASTHSFDLH